MSFAVISIIALLKIIKEIFLEVCPKFSNKLPDRVVNRVQQQINFFLCANDFFLRWSSSLLGQSYWLLNGSKDLFNLLHFFNYLGFSFLDFLFFRFNWSNYPKYLLDFILIVVLSLLGFFFQRHIKISDLWLTLFHVLRYFLRHFISLICLYLCIIFMNFEDVMFILDSLIPLLIIVWTNEWLRDWFFIILWLD